MGKEENNHSNSSSRNLRKPPPSLSTPGAHHMGGPGDFGQVNDGGLNTSYYNKTNDAAAVDPSAAAMRKKQQGDLMSKSGTEKTLETDSSVSDSAPARIPLEVDSFTPVRSDSGAGQCGGDDRKQWIISVALMVVTAILAVVIPCAVILTRDPAEPQPQVRATPAPIAAKPNMTLEELQALVPGLTQDTLQKIIEDETSPQAWALRWVQKDPNDWDAYEDWRKVQRYALSVFYHAMDGPSWNNFRFILQDWGSYHIHECDWMLRSRPHALDMCNEERRINVIELRSFDYLRGALPTELYLLDQLQTLDFSMSSVSRNMTYLVSFLLEENQDLSTFLPNLEHFSLFDTRLTGSIPTSLSTLTKLSSLDLSQNDLDASIPSQLGLLTNLEDLVLSNNALTGSIPTELNNLSQLQTFAVENNDKLESGPLPESFCSKEEPIMTDIVTDWCQGLDQCCSST